MLASSSRRFCSPRRCSDIDDGCTRAHSCGLPTGRCPSCREHIGVVPTDDSPLVATSSSSPSESAPPPSSTRRAPLPRAWLAGPMGYAFAERGGWVLKAPPGGHLLLRWDCPADLPASASRMTTQPTDSCGSRLVKSLPACLLSPPRGARGARSTGPGRGGFNDHGGGDERPLKTPTSPLPPSLPISEVRTLDG